MQSNKKVKEAETIDKILEQKFTIYFYEVAKKSLSEMKFFNILIAFWFKIYVWN